jgi:hypothetical protein
VTSRGTESVVHILRRWEDSGEVWRVLSRSPEGVHVALLTCDAGEEMDRFSSSDPRVLEFIGLRAGSDDPVFTDSPCHHPGH